MNELAFVAPRLGIAMNGLSLDDDEAERLNEQIVREADPLEREKIAWLSLFEAARLSIEHRTAIWFQ
jgi:hypothetical protein